MTRCRLPAASLIRKISEISLPLRFENPGDLCFPGRACDGRGSNLQGGCSRFSSGISAFLPAAGAASGRIIRIPDCPKRKKSNLSEQITLPV